MKDRLNDLLRTAQRAGRKLFCAYVTLGFPNLKTTSRVVGLLERAGTDILELGFPFSDPLADGPTIQFASERALRNKVRLEDGFRLISGLRRNGLRMPVLLFSYFNPLLQYGLRRLARQLRQSGFDGLIVPDLEWEGGREFQDLFHREGLSVIYLVAPTTPQARMRSIAERSDGFIYYVSLRGVTGARARLSGDLTQKLKILKRVTGKPILVGFGISQPSQVYGVTRLADGVIVGSALVDILRKGNRFSPRRLTRFVSRLVDSLRHAP